MKTTLAAIGFLILGGIAGVLLARREFAKDYVPIDVSRVGFAGGVPGKAGPIGPRVSILSSERYNFGEMDRNSKGHHDYQIRNEGDEPLTLEVGTTSCACTVAALNKSELAPGEETTITITWDTKKSTDIFEQHAEFRTNDPHRKSFQLRVFGRIIDTLYAEPRGIMLNDVTSQTGGQAVVRIYGIGAPEITVVKHKLANPKLAEFFDIKFEPLPAAEVAKRRGATAGLLMTVQLKPGAPLGEIEQGVLLTTNLNPEQTFDVMFQGKITSDISLAGQRTNSDYMIAGLGTFPSSAGASSTVYLLVKGPHRDRIQLNIAAVEPPTELQATLGEPLRDNPKIVRYPLTLTVAPGAAPVNRGSDGTDVVVRIATTHPDLKEVKLFARYSIVD